MTNSKSIYQDATDVSNDVYLVYVLYRDGDTPHYVGATQDLKRPYYDGHHARVDYNITSVEIVQEDLSRIDAGNLEDRLINQYGKSVDGGTLVNIQGGGHGLATEETKLKMSQSRKGRKCKPFSDEHRAKLSQSLKGRTLSEESIAKMAATKKGKPRSEETKLKISLAKKGVPMSEETKLKMSQSQKGRTLSEETRTKMSQSRKGKPMSEETKQKIRSTMRRRHGKDS